MEKLIQKIEQWLKLLKKKAIELETGMTLEKAHEQIKEALGLSQMLFEAGLIDCNYPLFELIFHCTASSWGDVNIIRDWHTMPCYYTHKERWSYKGKFYKNKEDLPKKVQGRSGRGWCFSLDTEVLTERGWKNHSTIKKSDKVFTIESGFISPLAINKFENQEGATCLTSNYSGKFSLNHKLFARSQNTKEFEKVEFEQVLKAKSPHVVKTSCYMENTSSSINPKFWSLLSAIVADGWIEKRETSIHAICFRFKKKRKIKYVSKLLDSLKIKYTKHFPKPEYTQLSVYEKSDLITKILKYIYKGQKKQLTWGIIKDANTVEALDYLIEGYLETDGIKDISKYKIGNKYQQIFSVNKQNIDIIQAACHLSGKRAKITTRENEEFERKQPLHSLSISKKQEVFLDIRNASISKGQFDTWSVDMGGKLILTRYKGIPQITSNSDIGYHFVITNAYPKISDIKGDTDNSLYNGVILPGRSLVRPGSHCKGRNSGSIGIALVGPNYDSYDTGFSLEQLNSARCLALALVILNTMDAAQIYGHSYYNTEKTCPIFDVSAEITTPVVDIIKTFQAGHGLTVDGIVGANTAKEITALK